MRVFRIFGLLPRRAPKPEHFENTAAQPPWLGSAEAASKEASLKESALKEAALKEAALKEAASWEAALQEVASLEATLKEVASGPLSGCGDCENKHRFGALPESRPKIGTLLKLCGAVDFQILPIFRSAWPAGLKSVDS